MTDKKVWFITGAGRGMGVDIAKAALAAGNAVVATGRNPDAVTQALGETDDLLAVKLDVTNLADAQAAVTAAVERFGRIDVLVNNAGNFYAGFFEEITPGDFREQVETTLFGPLNVTRAVLPVLRAQRAGLVVAISSTAGIVGQEFCTAYAAAKFGWRAGWSRWAPRWRRSASARCWWSLAFSAPSCSARSRPTTPSPRSRIMPSAPARPSLPGRP
jgi:NAD(P)-dependent dehydrogenase (short-subunit alcohol dehydrogenase family)